MKITTKSIYAIRALHTLNLLSEDSKPVGIATLSEKLGLSNKYLEQIFSNLKRSKLVISTAGKLGGYKLARPVEDISILDVITTMDGGLIPIHCVNNKNCTVCPECSINGLWYEMKNHMEEYLRNVNIASLNDKKYRLAALINWIYKKIILIHISSLYRKKIRLY